MVLYASMGCEYEKCVFGGGDDVMHCMRFGVLTIACERRSHTCYQFLFSRCSRNTHFVRYSRPHTHTEKIIK